MKFAFIATLTLLVLGLSGCTDGNDGETVPLSSAALTEKEVRVNESNVDGVDCGGYTHLKVDYTAGDLKSGRFSVIVFSESSRVITEEDGTQRNDRIQVFPEEPEGGTFEGTQTGTFEVDLSGTAGTWQLEVHRSREHDGEFLAVLTCA